MGGLVSSSPERNNYHNNNKTCVSGFNLCVLNSLKYKIFNLNRLQEQMNMLLI